MAADVCKQSWDLHRFTTVSSVDRFCKSKVEAVSEISLVKGQHLLALLYRFPAALLLTKCAFVLGDVREWSGAGGVAEVVKRGLRHGCAKERQCGCINVVWDRVKESAVNER